MNTTLKYLATLMLALAFLGCQNDSSEQAQNQKPNPKQGPMSQMQKPAPEVDLSDQEINQFVDAAMAAQKIQMQSRKQMMKIIQDSGLDIKTFQKIARSQQNPKSPDTLDVSDSDMKKYESARASMKKAQAKIQKQVDSAISESGMEVKRFRTISQAAQQDSVLQQKIRQKMQQRMKRQMKKKMQKKGMKKQSSGNNQ